MIPTNVPGINVSEYLPKLAGVMDQMALLRGMSTAENDHYRAKYLLHTGYPRMAGIEHPALGCIAASEVGTPKNEMPNFVTIDAGSDKGNGGRLYRSVPSYLGIQHAPLAVSDPDKGLKNLANPSSEEEFAGQLELLIQAEKRLFEKVGGTTVEARQSGVQRAINLMRSDKAKAFRIDEEPAKLREAYGDHKFGKSCLMARRLIEVGVSFVEIFHRGWDDHEGLASGSKNARVGWMPA